MQANAATAGKESHQVFFNMTASDASRPICSVCRTADTACVRHILRAVKRRQPCNLAACALGVRFGCASGVLLELDSEATDLNSDTPDPTVTCQLFFSHCMPTPRDGSVSQEEYDGDLGAPILKLPPVPTPAYNKLKFQLSSNGPVETSVQETLLCLNKGTRTLRTS